jgi:DNA polymerase I-like protein with 3'-5' exonuclease and polymerase domains
VTLADVYECDKRGAEICTQMTQTGFAFDVARARSHAERLRDAEADARGRANTAVGREIRATKTGGFGLKDLHAAFFRDLGAHVAATSVKTGRPSLGVDAMRVYASSQRPELRALALAVLEWRRARKVRTTYIEAIRLGSDLRVHPGWMNYGTVSGRFSCQGPNLMNLPRRENDPTREWGGIRALYVAKPGFVLVAFDAKQLEMRIAAYASGDPVMIAACNSLDLHCANAALVFGARFVPEEYMRLDAKKAAAEKGGPPLSPDEKRLYVALKALRSLAKSAGFAVCYLATAETVYARLQAAGENVRLEQVKTMLRNLHTQFHAYFMWQDRRLLDVIRTGYVESPILGRRRWLGHDPQPTEASNFPIQAGAADVMNERLPAIVHELERRSPRTHIVAQVHDSGVFETPEREASCVEETCHEIFEAPVTIASSGTMLTASFPIDVEVSERWH